GAEAAGRDLSARAACRPGCAGAGLAASANVLRAFVELRLHGSEVGDEPLERLVPLVAVAHAQQSRGMDRRAHARRERRVDEAAAVAKDPKTGAEQRLRRRRTAAHERVRLSPLE